MHDFGGFDESARQSRASHNVQVDRRLGPAMLSLSSGTAHYERLRRLVITSADGADDPPKHLH
jgi:hypothetical protein